MAILHTNIDLPLYRRGKVRDVYDLGTQLLMVATDRISAFDCVLPTAIPDKGIILTQMSLFWFDFIANIVPNHLITANVDDYPAILQPYRDQLAQRSMLVKRTEAIPVECVARGYLAGSGWKDYQQTGVVCGIKLPPNLVESSQLPEPIFTPATKAETGHDENISETAMANILGNDLTIQLKQLTLQIYAQVSAYAQTHGIIICDTKLEFGLLDGQIILIDEVLTPDSSRFWPQAQYQPGKAQPSFDKQYVRNYLETLTWDKRPPAPALPVDIVAATRAKYLEAYRLLTTKDIVFP